MSKDPGGLRSRPANSGVDAEWADRTGWGGAAENGSIQKLSRLVIPVPEGPSSGQACRKHKVPAEGEEPKASEGRGSSSPKQQGRSLPSTPKPADGGNCDYTQTRTDARTLDATSPGACT